jgi:RNA polymerase sigma factor (sigma-70 family)
MNRLLDHIRRLVEEPLSDADLLGRFIERREETAFATLLKRHGPMVLGVCRRILGNPHDAEDAFQATFLVLARRASSVRPREAVGNWLYGVAYRTALEARAKSKRRCAREKQVEEMPEPEMREPSDCHDLLSLLDREVHRLPDKYRLPVVLCDLEGRSRKEVARQLAIPEGTLSSRLATAHKKLAWRLTRFGVSVSCSSLAMLLAENAASACVPPSLFVATTKAAMLLAAGTAAGVSATVISLTEGVLRTMFIAKLKTATVLLCGVAALGLGTGGLWYQARVVASDSPRPGQKLVAVQADDEAARQEEARAREKSLRAEVEKARREAEMQRDRAEADRRRAEEALRALKEQLAKAHEAERQARQQAEKALYAQNIRQAQVDFVQPQTLNRLAELEAQTRDRFKKARQNLMEQMQKLDAEERETLQKLTDERSVLTKPQAENRAKPAGDKLDQILERLERMERRLEKLERGSTSSGSRR